MRIAFLSPYLDTFGGGEKYLLDIARAADLSGHETVIFWRDPSIKQKLIERFGSAYEFIRIDPSWHMGNFFTRLFMTIRYHAIFYHPDGSYFFSFAKKNIALLQVPDTSLVPSQNLLNRLKLKNWTGVFNSHFTERFFRHLLQLKNPHILYPTLSDELFTLTAEKEHIILSVGRFFSHLHSKKQEVLIQAFVRAQKKYHVFKKYRLILAGSVKKEDEAYFNKLKKSIAGYPTIALLRNVSQNELFTLYGQARFYWHAAGFGSNEKKHPEKMEHFGISIIEAMAAGCVPFCFKGGGPKETVLHNKTGFLYTTRTELIDDTFKLMKDKKLCIQFAKHARARAAERFAFSSFLKKVQTLLQ